MTNTSKQLELFRLHGSASTRQTAIDEVAELLVAAGAVDPEYKVAMHQRDSESSTYLGNFLALPHGTKESLVHVHQSAIAVVSYREAIDWQPGEVHFVIGLAAKQGEHLSALSAVTKLFTDQELVAELRNANSTTELQAIFNRAKTQ